MEVKTNRHQIYCGSERGVKVEKIEVQAGGESKLSRSRTAIEVEVTSAQHQSMKNPSSKVEVQIGIDTEVRSGWHVK